MTDLKVEDKECQFIEGPDSEDVECERISCSALSYVFNICLFNLMMPLFSKTFNSNFTPKVIKMVTDLLFLICLPKSQTHQEIDSVP